MTPRPKLTVTLITLNESAVLRETLARLSWADEVVVVDSGSTDDTRAIAEAAGAKTLSQRWLGYGAQKNFAQSQATHDWVLNIDADERVTPELQVEIESFLGRPELRPTDTAALPRITPFLGRWIRHGGWYPNHVTRLGHKAHARWTEPALHEQLVGTTPPHRFRNPLIHLTFRTLLDQVRTNLRFAEEGAQGLRKNGRTFSVLKLLFKPFGKWLETYILKQGFRDGIPGFLISINAAHSMFLKMALLYTPEQRLDEDSPPRP